MPRTDLCRKGDKMCGTTAGQLYTPNPVHGGKERGLDWLTEKTSTFYLAGRSTFSGKRKTQARSLSDFSKFRVCCIVFIATFEED